MTQKQLLKPRLRTTTPMRSLPKSLSAPRTPGAARSAQGYDHQAAGRERLRPRPCIVWQSPAPRLGSGVPSSPRAWIPDLANQSKNALRPSPSGCLTALGEETGPRLCYGTGKLNKLDIRTAVRELIQKRQDSSGLRHVDSLLPQQQRDGGGQHHSFDDVDEGLVRDAVDYRAAYVRAGNHDDAER